MKNDELKSSVAVALRVYAINDEAEGLKEAIGVSDERSEEIIKELQRLNEEKLNVSKMLEEVSKFVKNANELVFCGYIVGTSVTEHLYRQRDGSATETTEESPN